MTEYMTIKLLPSNIKSPLQVAVQLPEILYIQEIIRYVSQYILIKTPTQYKHYKNTIIIKILTLEKNYGA